MKSVKLIYLKYFIIFFLIGQNIIAENNSPKKYANLIYSDTGFDHALLATSIGYGRFFHSDVLQRKFLLFADYGKPLVKLNWQDFRVRIGAGVSAIDYKNFSLPVRLSLIINGAENKAFQAIAIGSGLTLSPGYYGEIFELAGEFSIDQNWATNIKHSDLYREYFYENAKNGWYSMSSTSLRAGMHVGFWLHQRFMLGLKGGYQRYGQYDVFIPPIYTTLNLQLLF